MTEINKLVKTYRKEKERRGRLRAKWSVEMQQDLVAFHCPLLIQKLVNVISKEIQINLDTNNE